MTVLTKTRYQWNSGTGAWATLHQSWASGPGRGYAEQRSSAPDGDLSVCYQGFPEGLTYVMPYLHEQGGLLAGPTRRVGWREIRAEADQSPADLLVVGCSRQRALRLPTDRSVLLPFRVHLLLDVVGDVQQMYQQVSRNERRQFSNLRRQHEWASEISTDLADLEFFYERMHLPTMASRHGEEARSTDWDTALHCLFREGFLLFVTEGGKRVTGVLCRLEDEGTTLRMRLLGALDGDETHYRSGAVKAVYYLTMEWAAANGVTRIDFSGADPFPGKGVFQFKRRFHPTVAHPVDHYRDRRVYLRVMRDTPAVRDFLVATPMLTVNSADELIATHFRDALRPARTSIRADGAGVHSARTIDLDEFLAGAAQERTPALVNG